MSRPADDAHLNAVLRKRQAATQDDDDDEDVYEPSEFEEEEKTSWYIPDVPSAAMPASNPAPVWINDWSVAFQFKARVKDKITNPLTAPMMAKMQRAIEGIRLLITSSNVTGAYRSRYHNDWRVFVKEIIAICPLDPLVTEGLLLDARPLVDDGKLGVDPVQGRPVVSEGYRLKQIDVAKLGDEWDSIVAQITNSTNRTLPANVMKRKSNLVRWMGLAGERQDYKLNWSALVTELQAFANQTNYKRGVAQILSGSLSIVPSSLEAAPVASISSSNPIFTSRARTNPQQDDAEWKSIPDPPPQYHRAESFVPPQPAPIQSDMPPPPPPFNRPVSAPSSSSSTQPIVLSPDSPVSPSVPPSPRDGDLRAELAELEAELESNKNEIRQWLVDVRHSIGLPDSEHADSITILKDELAREIRDVVEEKRPMYASIADIREEVGLSDPGEGNRSIQYLILQLKERVMEDTDRIRELTQRVNEMEPPRERRRSTTEPAMDVAMYSMMLSMLIVV